MGQTVYAVWRAGLRKELLPPSEHIPTGVGGVDGHPQCGLYRVREGGGYQDGKRVAKSEKPVRIYLEDASGAVAHEWADGLTLKALKGKDEVVDPLRIWSWCLTKDKAGKVAIVNAITRDEYAFWIANGRWSDDAPEMPQSTPPSASEHHPEGTPSTSAAPSAGIGHNSAEDPDGFEALVRLIEQHDTTSAEWVGQNPEGKSAGDKAANWLNEVRGLKAKYEALYKEKRKPLDDALEAFENQWRPFAKKVEAARARLYTAVQVIGDKERRRLEAIQRAEAEKKAAEIRARLEAERKAKIAEQERLRQEREAEAAKAAQEGGTLLPLMEPAVEPVKEPEPAPVPPVVVAVEPVKLNFGGSTGARVAVAKPVKCAVITDWAAAAAHYSGADKVREAVQKLADADAKKGIQCPGSVISETTAAA